MTAKHKNVGNDHAKKSNKRNETIQIRTYKKNKSAYEEQAHREGYSSFTEWATAQFIGGLDDDLASSIEEEQERKTHLAKRFLKGQAPSDFHHFIEHKMPSKLLHYLADELQEQACLNTALEEAFVNILSATEKNSGHRKEIRHLAKEALTVITKVKT